MIGNNSCGVHSVMAQFYGPGPRTSDNVAELEVLTYRGARLRVGAGGAGVPDELAARLRALADRYGDLIRERYPKIPRRVSGYNLDDLLPENGFHVARALAGTEGTCVTVLEATVHLIDSPPCRSLARRRATTTPRPRPTTCSRCSSTSRSGSRASTTS